MEAFSYNLQSLGTDSSEVLWLPHHMHLLVLTWHAGVVWLVL